MKFLLFSKLSLLALVQVAVCQDVGFEELCGDCWCTIDDGSESCPALGNTIRYNIDPAWEALYSFNLVSPSEPIQLTASDGSDGACSPFKDSLGDDLPDFAEGQLPQCVLNPPQNGNFCAYKYPNADGGDGEEETCKGRDYEMASYGTVEEIEADGAHLMHEGACGVCSNAQDIWTKMETLDNVAQRSVVCAVSYIISQDFQGVVDCMYDIGWSQPCAYQWAHYTIANGILCAGVCVPDASNDVVANGPAPECAYTDCFTCARDQYKIDDVHYNFTGYNGVKGGLVDRTPVHKCSVYQPVVYDPCVGSKAGTGLGSTNSGGQGGNDSSQATTRTSLLVGCYLLVAVVLSTA